jgi:hypothetical protein
MQWPVAALGRSGNTTKATIFVLCGVKTAQLVELRRHTGCPRLLSTFNAGVWVWVSKLDS